MKYVIFITLMLIGLVHCSCDSEGSDYENGPESELVNDFFDKFKAERARVRLQDGHVNISKHDNVKSQLTIINSRIEDILDVLNDPDLDRNQTHFFDDIEVQVQRFKSQLAEVTVSKQILQKKYQMDNKEIEKFRKLTSDTNTMMKELIILFEKKIGRRI